jgi:hypothetical protein
MKEKITIANAAGFWGDERDAIRRQVLGGPIDYLTMDYLAEITMIILGRQIAKNPEAGYARDFVEDIGRLLPEIADRGITVITNAGGINPRACARAVATLVDQSGYSLPVAAVDGDNLMPEFDQLIESGVEFNHIDTGTPLGDRRRQTVAANAYIGAVPIVAALKKGARIIITGRCYDAASVLAPFVYEFGWRWDDHDRLAAALLAGHLIECGTQSTGGNFTGWRSVESFLKIGYPLIEAFADGSFVLTKHPNTGGLVSAATAKEQVLYEIGDPRAYISPDVIADFTSFTLTADGKDRVRCSGVRGRKPTPTLKVSLAYQAGYKTVGLLVVSGPDAVDKGRVFAEMFWDRVGTDGLIDRRTDYVGYNACWGSPASPDIVPNEIILRFAARAEDKTQLEKISTELAGLVLSGPPGVTVFGGRPPVTPAYGFWPALIPRNRVKTRLTIRDDQEWFDDDPAITEELMLPLAEEAEAEMPASTKTVRLGQIAHARSGDKGSTANIGVIALKPEYYPEIIREVTTDRIGRFFAANVKGPIERYRLDNLQAVNFVLQNALNGGGTVSLLLDNQGKTLAQALLMMEIEIDARLS